MKYTSNTVQNQNLYAYHPAYQLIKTAQQYTKHLFPYPMFNAYLYIQMATIYKE